MNKLNRAQRRRVVMAVANNTLKKRNEHLDKKQYGIGLMITNRMGALTFWCWTVILWDRRDA